MEALILFVPWPGMLTQESRGTPRIVTLCLARLIPTIWIESASPRSYGCGGRAPLPTTRMKIGLDEVSEGVYPAWASPSVNAGLGLV